MSRKKRIDKILILILLTGTLFIHAVCLAGTNSTSLKQRIIVGLQRTGISEESIVVLVSTLPVLELRGSIPLALYTFDMSYIRSYILSVVGNLLPIIPLLLFLTRIAKILSRYKPLGKLLNWFFDLTRKRGGLVEKYEAIGLIAFVAIPLPVTGAWTGAVASVLFGLRFRYALPSICLGVLTAGLIVSGACWLGINLFS